MIVLSNTTDRLFVVLGGAITTNQLRCVTSWRDRTSTTFTADRTVANTNSTTDVSLAGSPAASTQRLIDLVSVYNSDTVTAIVTIKYDANGTQYTMSTFTLLTGESVEFVEGNMWTVYTASGVVKETQNAGGANTQIQYNKNEVLEGNPNLTYDEATNVLALAGVDAVLRMTGITTEPTAPADGLLNIYSKAVCGKMMLKQIGPSGLDTPLQNAIWQNNTVLFTPGAAAGVWQGTSGSNLGVPTIALPTTTNLATALRRSLFPTVVTTLNQQVGTRTEAMFFRGNIAGMGGFFMATRFMLSNWTTGDRLFVGFSSVATSVVTVEPSSLLNILGFGIDAADTAITFMHNDGTGTCTKDAIAGQPALAINNGYVAYIFCKPNDSTVYYRLDNLLTGAVLIDTSATTDLPVNTTPLVCQAIIGNAANTAVNAASIGINRIYIETDN